MSPAELSNLTSAMPDFDQGVHGDTVVDAAIKPSFSSDASHFEASLSRAESVQPDSESMEIAKAVLEPFNALNIEAAELAEYAQSAQQSGDNFTPSEIVTMTYKAQEFGFHSQLTSNIANRLADGVQQLFRQQG